MPQPMRAHSPMHTNLVRPILLPDVLQVGEVGSAAAGSGTRAAAVRRARMHGTGGRGSTGQSDVWNPMQLHSGITGHSDARSSVRQPPACLHIQPTCPPRRCTKDGHAFRNNEAAMRQPQACLQVQSTCPPRQRTWLPNAWKMHPPRQHLAAPLSAARGAEGSRT